MKKKMVGLVIVGVLAVSTLTGCTEKFKRTKKSWNSNLSGGLDRVVEVYDYDGELIKEYEGKLDVEFRGDGEVKFDLNNKRIMIKNAIVIVEEQ